MSRVARWALASLLTAAAVTGALQFQPRPLDLPVTDLSRPMPDPGELWLPNQAGSLKFAVMGDVGRGDDRQYDTARQMADWHERFHFDFVLMLGDNIYGPGTPDDYRQRFERPYKALIDRGVLFRAVLGNHDPPGQEHYRPFGMQDRRYYTFNRLIGPPWSPRRVQFFALDTVNFDRQQRRWFERALQESDASWKVVALHHPLYTSGRYRWRAAATRSGLESLFVEFGVDVAFSGHEHFYERLVPHRGVQYFTSGAGGALRPDDLRPSAMTAAGFDRDTHFMLIEINGDTLTFQVVSRTGHTVDYGEVAR